MRLLEIKKFFWEIRVVNNVIRIQPGLPGFGTMFFPPYLEFAPILSNRMG